MHINQRFSIQTFLGGSEFETLKSSRKGVDDRINVGHLSCSELS